MVIRRILVAGLSAGVMLAALSGFAQTPPSAPSIQNQPAPPSSPAGAGTDLSGTGRAAVPGGLTAVPVPGVGTIPSSSRGKSFGSAGQGLPGMPGGPPVNGALGAQDTSGKYMRPPVIPPLLCDPATDLPC